ncbi:MAG TPA: FHA domain-containing protein [Kofleriaceae bacterium]|nr:FHA domain-containing protein [Kofleriaceae bacterium]
MTAKRNLKRRVRERQTRTGESYVTARRRVLAARASGSVHGASREPGASGAAASEDPTGEIAVQAARSASDLPRTAAAGSPATTQPLADREPPLSVVQLHDVTAEAARLGFQCKVMMFPALRDRAEPSVVLAGLRDALIGRPGDRHELQAVTLARQQRHAATSIAGDPGDPNVVELFGLAFGVPLPARSRQRRVDLTRMQALRGLGLEFVRGPSGAMIVFRAAGHQATVPVLCMRWGSGLVLTMVYDEIALALLRAATSEAPEGVGALEIGAEVRVMRGPFSGSTATVEDLDADARELTVALSLFEEKARVKLDIHDVETIAPVLFLIHDGRRHPITASRLIIGRASTGLTASFVIRDTSISKRHAEVVRRGGVYYLKDAGSTNGIYFKGMRIDNKRIDEGDVFQLGNHELRFTYRAHG